jgi:predicted nucleic acid-binding protein
MAIVTLCLGEDLVAALRRLEQPVPDVARELIVTERLFTSITIPPAVVRETARSVPVQPWIVEHPLSSPGVPRSWGVSLGPGEAEAIALAVQLQARCVLRDAGEV